MSRTVIKYGGSNLWYAAGLIKLTKILPAYENPVVVVSALNGVTDSILAFIQQKELSKLAVKNFSDLLYNKHSSLVKEVVESTVEQNRINRALNESINELEHILLGIHYLNDLSPDYAELILSYGERLSALLIHEICNYFKLPCRLFLPEEIGLIAVGEPGMATVDLEQSASSVNQALNGTSTAIIPGFYGINGLGKVRTFGRGGTDYSAACIAHCIDAKSLDIWKDTDGFQSSDPREVEQTVSLSALTYSEAAELSYYGAKILHPMSVEPLIEKQIPIRLFNNQSEEIRPKSIINGARKTSPEVVKSITFSDQHAIVKIEGSCVGQKQGLLAKICTTLDQNGINISSVITSQTAINLIVDSSKAKRSVALIYALEQPVIKTVKAIQEISLLAVVGSGMTEQHGIASQLFSVLAENCINVLLSALGASEVTINVIINRENRALAVKKIHESFFKKQ